MNSFGGMEATAALGPLMDIDTSQWLFEDPQGQQTPWAMIASAPVSPVREWDGSTDIPQKALDDICASSGPAPWGSREPSPEPLRRRPSKSLSLAFVDETPLFAKVTPTASQRGGDPSQNGGGAVRAGMSPRISKRKTRQRKKRTPGFSLLPVRLDMLKPYVKSHPLIRTEEQKRIAWSALERDLPCHTELLQALQRKDMLHFERLLFTAVSLALDTHQRHVDFWVEYFTKDFESRIRSHLLSDTSFIETSMMGFDPRGTSGLELMQETELGPPDRRTTPAPSPVTSPTGH